MSPVPATILTGFLGAGKTTLLNRILHESHGLRIAVIENEFGQENIDNEILVRDSNEHIVEMNNGCICCTVRGDLILALNDLARRRDAGELHFDRVVIETTGLANPGPVAQTFFADEEVGTNYLLDAIITVVDARHGMQQLDQQEEARLQVGFADRILLSKSDLASDSEIADLRQRLLHMNPRAPIIKADFGRVALEEVLDLRGFNLNDKLEIASELLATDQHVHEHEPEHEHEHGEHCGSDCNHHAGHEHDTDPHAHPRSQQHLDDISAFVFRSERAFNSDLLNDFLSAVVQVYGPRMLRYKGVLLMEGADRKVIFQGVHQIMGTDIGGKWDEAEQRSSKIVFIGKNLPRDTFISGLEQCLV